MISLSLGGLVSFYATALAALLLLWWLGREFFHARRQGRRRRHAIHCAICGAIYEDTAEEILPACPQCGRRNERQPPGAV